MPAPVLRRWGRDWPGIVLTSVALLASIVAGIVVEPEIALLALPIAGLLGWLLTTYIELTEDELILRYPFSPTHIPRAKVDFAKFEYAFLGGSQLWIHLRDGSITKVGLTPKLTSSELSGDPAQPGSAAYEITAWARK